MKKTFRFPAMFCVMVLLASVLTGAVKPDSFDKYEIVSTPERSVAGIDAGGLMVYGKHEGIITAYDLVTDTPAFDLGENQDRVAPFNSDGTAVITGKEGYAATIVSRNGTMLAQIPEGYSYGREFECGYICIIDKNATENVYTLIDRKGKILAEHFYEPAAELKNGDVIISNAGGGHSLIKTDGTVEKMPYLQNVRIEDAVSLNTGVYVSTDGNVYSYSNELLYKNVGFDRISPIDEHYALGVKNAESNPERYIIDIKNKKETKIQDNGLFEGYIYSKGNVCDDKAFVGNSEKSVLVNLKNGKVISAVVSDYSDFCEGIATVRTESEKKPYAFMNCDGEFVGEAYDFASSFEKGYSVIAEKVRHLVVVSIMNEKGKKVHMESVFARDFYSDDGKPVYMTEGFKSCRFDEITVEKKSGGNFLINNPEGNSYIFVYKGDGNAVVKAIAGIGALVAVAWVVYTVGGRHKRKKENEKSED